MSMVQALRKVLFSCPGTSDLSWQTSNFSSHLPNGQGTQTTNLPTKPSETHMHTTALEKHNLSKWQTRSQAIFMT